MKTEEVVKRITFIGLGQVGRWMAPSLLNAHFDMTVLDIDNKPRSFSIL
ncbi:MAG: hypothetical protein GTN81_16320 [Proteobacteria bacterium]|nr:hypothetical protein [Pseudomonadota bacterium]